MSLTLTLSDEQATILQAKAAAEGLSLEKWLEKLDDRRAQQNAGIELPVLHMGLMGSLHRRDIYDDVD